MALWDILPTIRNKRSAYEEENALQGHDKVFKKCGEKLCEKNKNTHNNDNPMEEYNIQQKGTNKNALCQLYLTHERKVEQLVRLYLRLGEEGARRAIQRFCHFRLSRQAEEQYEEMLGWLNWKLAEDDLETKLNALVDDEDEEFKREEVKLYPSKLNLILLPRSYKGKHFMDLSSRDVRKAKQKNKLKRAESGLDKEKVADLTEVSKMISHFELTSVPPPKHIEPTLPTLQNLSKLPTLMESVTVYPKEFPSVTSKQSPIPSKGTPIVRRCICLSTVLTPLSLIILVIVCIIAFFKYRQRKLERKGTYSRVNDGDTKRRDFPKFPERFRQPFSRVTKAFGMKNDYDSYDDDVEDEDKKYDLDEYEEYDSELDVHEPPPLVGKGPKKSRFKSYLEDCRLNKSLKAKNLKSIFQKKNEKKDVPSTNAKWKDGPVIGQ